MCLNKDEIKISVTKARDKIIKVLKIMKPPSRLKYEVIKRAVDEPRNPDIWNLMYSLVRLNIPIREAIDNKRIKIPKVLAMLKKGTCWRKNFMPKSSTKNGRI